MRIVAPIQKGKKWRIGTCFTAESPTYRGPAPPWNTSLTVDLPHHGTPYSQWTCLTVEHPTHSGSAPLRSTLLTEDLPHHGTPYSPVTYSMLNTII